MAEPAAQEEAQAKGRVTFLLGALSKEGTIDKKPAPGQVVILEVRYGLKGFEELTERTTVNGPYTGLCLLTVVGPNSWRWMRLSPEGHYV